MENPRFTLLASTHADIILPMMREDQKRPRGELGKSTPIIMDAVEKGRGTIQSLYPELEEIPQLAAPIFGTTSFEYVGDKQSIEEAAKSLSHVVHVETRKRMYQIRVLQVGTDMGGYKNERDFIEDRDLLLEEASIDA